MACGLLLPGMGMTGRLSSQDLEFFTQLLGAVRVIHSGSKLKRLSQDFFWYSPVLKPILEDKQADAALKLESREELKEVVAYCAARRIPVTVRGGGTGNYGQCIPLYGGVLLDLSGLDRIHSVDGVVRAEPGARLGTIETRAREVGWELRCCMPSTWVKSTLAGFLCGGSGGIGSVRYGGIEHGDTVKSLTILTVEPEPRELRFEERDCMAALHTYGTTGILVEIEMRLAPAYDWEQLIFASTDWERILSCAHQFANNQDYVKRLVSLFELPVTDFFTPMKTHLPSGFHRAFIMVRSDQADQLVADFEAEGLRCEYRKHFGNPPKPPFIMDYTWNHTTLWALKQRPDVTYLQSGFGQDFSRKMQLLRERFPGEILQHLEWTLSYAKMQTGGDSVECGGIPLVFFKSSERLREILDYCEAIGVYNANPHTYLLEEGGSHPNIDAKRALKDETDPFAILNPGKMKTYPRNPFSGACE